MIPRKGGDGQAPSPELLAAYADGELDRGPRLALRAQVEEWLASHPNAAAEVAAQRRLGELCRSVPLPEPSEPAWAAVFARVEASLTQSAAARGRLPLARVLAWGAAVVASAAAVWLALTWLPQGGEPPRDPQRGESTAIAVQQRELLPVASADEVEVLSVAGADTSSLVVGHLPLQGPMVLAGPGDVTVTSAPADVRQEGPAPLIWARTDGELQEDDPEPDPSSGS